MSRNFFKEFEDDPFFGGPPPAFGSMPALQDLMGIGGPSNGNGRGNSQLDRRENGGSRLDPFASLFQQMHSMSNNMGSVMENIKNNEKDGHCFTASTVMHYENDGKSKPKIYQASTSTRTAPGHIKETRRALRDSERGIEKMAVGHHIGERGKVVERRRLNGSHTEEEKSFIHMSEDQVPDFENEWRKKTSGFAVGAPRNPRSIHDHHPVGGRDGGGRRSGIAPAQSEPLQLGGRPSGPGRKHRSNH